MLLHAPQKPDPLHLLLSVISVPLGWTTLHIIMAFHYAHLFYARLPPTRRSMRVVSAFPSRRSPARGTLSTTHSWSG